MSLGLQVIEPISRSYTPYSVDIMNMLLILLLTYTLGPSIFINH
jgi:hypothetical protein